MKNYEITCKSSQTCAGVPIHEISTRSIVLTRVIERALIYIYFAVTACESIYTQTLVAVEEVDTGARVLTWVGRTFVDV